MWRATRVVRAAASSAAPGGPLGAGKTSPVMHYPPPPPGKLEAPKTLGGFIANALLVMTGMQSKDAVGMRRARESYKMVGDIYEERKAFFGQTCALPDTFQSWFLVTHMHLWLMSSRLRAAGDEGKAVNAQLMQLFMDDSEQRIADLGVNRIDKHMRVLIAQYNGVNLAYDDGVVRDDMALAEALWRNMTDMKGSAVEVANLVQYVRQQGTLLDSLSLEDALQGQFTFAPPAEL